MIRLQTLGSTFLSGPDGSPLQGAATHRRTLALLGLLSASGSAGLSRDRIVGLLWPDSDESRARHSLTQALYAARRALGCDDLFLINGPDIRLNPARLSSDIQEFEERLARGDLAQAVELYRGPFLDAVFLTDAAEFERWSAGERERISRLLVDALDALAMRSESAGEHEDAVKWRRRQATLLPLDARIAARLMTAMAAAGDRAGALRHAQVHASLLQQELDLPPDPHIVELTERLRAPSRATPTRELNRVAETVAPMSTDAPPIEHPQVPAPSALTAFAARHTLSRAWIAASILIVLILGVGGAVIRQRGVKPAATSSALAQRVVVAPFRVTGADPSLTYLRDGMVELLSARLADDSGSRSVDAGAVLREWRAAGLGATANVGRDTALNLAAALGAERVVMGSVVGTPARVVLSATMLDVTTRSVTAEVTAVGSADSLVSLIDQLAARLLVSVAGQDDVLAHSVSASLPALKDFLAGQAAYRREDHSAALGFYERAIRSDSSFALAALNAAEAADALELTGALLENVDIAWKSRGDLNQRDLALLRAFTGPRYPLPSSAAELANAWQGIVDAAPQSSDAWYALAVRLLEDGPPAGLTDAHERAIGALNRALAVSERHVRARALVAALTGERPTRATRAGDSLDAATSWRVALTAGDSSARRRLRAQFRTMDAASLRAIALAGQHDERGHDDARAALEQLRTRDGTLPERLALTLLEHSLAMNEGRTGDALAATDRLRRVLPGADAWLRLRVLDALYANGDSAAATNAMRTLSARDPAAPLARAVTSAGGLANACVVAQWRLSNGDTNNVRRTITALRGAATNVAPSPVSATPGACAELLEAWLSVQLRRADARARVQRADSLVFTPQTAGDAAQYANLAVARLFLRVGDTTSALASVRKRPYMSGAPHYLATARALETALAQAASVRATPQARGAPPVRR